MNKFTVNIWAKKLQYEFDNVVDAKVFAEKFERAELIKWYVHPNLPGLKPDLVYNSISLFTWEDNGWKGHYIHGPGGGTYDKTPDQE